MRAFMSPDLQAPDALAQSSSQPLARRAALTLHALGAADRAWLLAQLPRPQRERLQGMLQELETLGIPASHDLLQDLMGAAGAAGAVPNPAAGVPPPMPADVLPTSGGADFSQQQAALSRMDAASVARVLQNEPAGLIAQLLSIHAWPWREAVLEQLGLVKRRRVEELLDSWRRQVRPSMPDALHRTLVEAVHGRAAGAASLAGPAVSPLQAGPRGAMPAGSGRGAVRAGWLRFWPKGRR